MGSRVCTTGAGVTNDERVKERAAVLRELEELPDEALISTRRAGHYLDMDPRNVVLMYHDKLIDGIQARGPCGRIKIRLGSLRKMSGQAKKVRR